MISNNRKKINLGILLGCLICFFFISQINHQTGTENIADNNFENNVKTSPDPIYEATSIYIDNTDPSNDWAMFQFTYAWCTGDGSSTDPYTIPQVLTTQITIKNSDANFSIIWCDVNTISLNNVTNGRIQNNDCSGGITGISLYDCHYNWIAYTNFQGGSGISGAYSTYNEFYGNNFLNCYRGINIEHCFNNTVDYNVISDSSEYCVRLYNSDYNYITRNDLSSIHVGVSLSSSNHNTVFNNTVHDVTEDWSFGMYSGGDYNNISNNIIERCNMLSIYIEGDSNVISDNVIDMSNETGIKIEDSTNFLVTNNLISNILGFGIEIINSESGVVSENSLYGCGFNVEGNVFLIGNLDLNNSNQVNDKPVYFYEWKSGLYNIDVINAGQIILYACVFVDLSNLNLNNCTIGLSLYHCVSINITDSEFNYNRYSGIQMKLSNSIRFSNINATNNGYGINFDNCNFTTIKDSTITYNEVGIYGKAGIYVFVKDNLISYNEYDGIHIYSGDNYNISNNRIERNGEYGIYLYSSQTNYILGNFVNYNTIAGIYLYYSSNNKILDNTATYNGDYGFKLYHSSENNISKNTLTSNYDTTTSSDWSSTGLYMQGCSYNLVIENYIQNHQISMSIEGSHHINITKNLLYDGLRIRSSTFCTFSKNLLDGTATPSFETIFVSYSLYCIFTENTLKFARFRIEYDSENNSFVGNIISDCDVAFTFSSSSYNEVRNNKIYRVGQCFKEVGDCVGNIFVNNYCEEGYLVQIIIAIIIVGITVGGIVGLIFLRKRMEKRKLNQ